jgi:hypothetical protein
MEGAMRVFVSSSWYSIEDRNKVIVLKQTMNHSQMGVKQIFGDESYTMKTDYLVLPVLAKLYVLPQLSVDLGPQFGYMLSAKDSEGESYYDMEGLKKFDVSFAAGLSYKICDKFDVSARYNLGLTKIQDESDQKNGVISFGVGYRF